jgi:ABC-type branched-subunit amino acid transport system ATPase component/branched-subunit amino acid ABC-type transport system permease component
MSELAHFVLLGLAVGALYALTAQGLVLIYRGSGVVNLAQGALAMLGAFLYFESTGSRGWPAAAGWAVALGVPAALGALTHLVVMRRLRRASALVRLVATLGVFFFMTAIGYQIWGFDSEPVRSPLPDTVYEPFGRGSAITADRLWIIAIVILLTVLLSAAFRWTRFGAATEAVAENQLAASALGLSPDRIAAVNWALGSMFAAAAGVLIAPILFLSVDALSYTVLRGLAAALVGRFRSFWATLAGAFGIGVVESLLGNYIDHRGVFEPVTNREGLLFGEFTASSVSRSVAFLIIVIVLAVGGTALPLRHELLERLPALGRGTIRWPALFGAVVAASVILVTAPDDWATALVISMGTAIVCLSVVVVTGFVGQLSLAQVALAGFGAWVSGRLAAEHDLPFLLVVLIAVAAAVPVGVLVAIPALRTRGVSLAVLTLGLSVMAYELVFSNGALVGGFLGTQVPPPDVFGWSVDPAVHPGRYAVVVLLALTLAAVIAANARRGRIGRRLVAVRGNERAAAALGINVAGAKLFAFGLGAAIAALGGCFLAFRQSTINYAAFAPFLSIAIVVYAVIGGVGFVLGALFAAPFAVGGIGSKISDALGFGDNALNLFSGALLLVLLMANPNGIAYTTVEGTRGAWRRLRRHRDAEPHARVHIASDAPVARRPPATLSIDELTVRFGGVVAVDHVSFAVRPGEVVGLIGPNGAGKTTIIDAVTGFVPTAPGSSIRLDATDLRRMTPSQRARVGVGRTFQSVELFDDMTVLENLLAASDDRSSFVYAADLVRPARTIVPRDVWDVVVAFGLEADLHRHPDHLPFGRRRLVAVARTVAARPSTLLLDEPAAGLSDAESRHLGEVIVDLAHTSGLAVLMIEHDLALVSAICDRAVVLDFGRMIAAGPPHEVTRNELVVAAYVGDPGTPLDRFTPEAAG